MNSLTVTCSQQRHARGQHCSPKPTATCSHLFLPAAVRILSSEIHKLRGRLQNQSMIERSKSQWKGSCTMSLSTLIYLGCLSFSFIMTKHRWNLPQGSFATHWSSQKISCWWKEETLEVKTGCYFPWKKAELTQSDNSTCILHILKTSSTQ